MIYSTHILYIPLLSFQKNIFGLGLIIFDKYFRKYIFLFVFSGFVSLIQIYYIRSFNSTDQQPLPRFLQVFSSILSLSSFFSFAFTCNVKTVYYISFHFCWHCNGHFRSILSGHNPRFRQFTFFFSKPHFLFTSINIFHFAGFAVSVVL